MHCREREPEVLKGKSSVVDLPFSASDSFYDFGAI